VINLSRLLDRRREHWVLATMLIVLNLALRADFGSALSASLMTAHLGLFFLWQPIWQRDQRLDRWSAALIIVSTGAFIAALNWWLLFGWMILLVGIVAGRSFSTRQERLAYMITLTFLISVLLIECVPMIFDVGKLNNAVLVSFRLAWTALPLLLLLFPTYNVAQRETFPIDFFRGITIALMTALLAVSSVLMTYELRIEYPVTLIAGLLVLSSFLFLVSWLITPGTGSGLGALWEKSVLNIGTPFESWLSSLAQLAGRRQQPREFLDAAIEELCEIPWIQGAEWAANGQQGQAGNRAGFNTLLTTGELEVTLFTERPVGPSLLIHCRLLIQVLGHFFSAKIRETELAHQAHLRAVHETGARLTHDIKNLLQSLKTTTAAILEDTGPSDSERSRKRQSLLRRQLPHITQRLQLSLDKLQQPSSQQSERIAISVWWDLLLSRYDAEDVEFLADIHDGEFDVPGDCFDSVVENLLDNARNKAKTSNAIQVKVGLYEKDGDVILSVVDNGAAIEATLASQILTEPVPSDNGLGIGLYQSAQQAALNGFQLVLSENETGAVRFTLTNRD
jgi:Histidine kinase-, DNA gyrase B-, and HSP90-like ATPase